MTTRIGQPQSRASIEVAAVNLIAVLCVVGALLVTVLR